MGDNDGATELAMGKIGQPLVDPLLVWKDKERRGPNEVMVILQKSHLNYIRTKKWRQKKGIAVTKSRQSRQKVSCFLVHIMSEKTLFLRSPTLD